MCIMCVASRWSRRIVTMLPCVVIPLLVLWALSQLLPPRLRVEVTSPRLACVFVLLVILAWYEVIMPRLLQWRARRSALLRDRRRIQAQEEAKWRKEATRRCRNCLTAYRDQAPAGGRFMCTYCGHLSRRPVLDIPGIASGLVSSGIPSNGVLLKEGIGQIGIPLESLYGEKNIKAWNRKGWQVGTRAKMGDNPWGKEWPGGESWLKGGVGTTKYNTNVFGDVFAAGEKCSACESYPRFVIFFLRILGLLFFCMRWAWRRVFGRGHSLGPDEALNSGSKGRKNEEGYSAPETRGEKARRKAMEKKQARLEKEMREEEERKQREEVARLVDEQRRLRDEQLKAERDSERETAAQREREREVDKRRHDKGQEKEKRLSKEKLRVAVEEATKKVKENVTKGESEKKEVPKTATFYVTEKKGAKNYRYFGGLRNNEQGMKGGPNSAFKIGGSRYFVPLKGSFQSPPKSSPWQLTNVVPLPAKGIGMHSRVGVKTNRPGDVVSLSNSNTSLGCTTVTQSTGSAWNKTGWAIPWGRGSDIVNENASQREIDTPNNKGEKNSSFLEAQVPAGNCAIDSPRIKHLQPSVGSQLQAASSVSTKANSLDPRLRSPSVSCFVGTSAGVGSSLKQEHQIEAEASLSSSSSVCFGSAPAVLLPQITTMPMSSNSVPDCTSLSINSDTVSPCISMSPNKLVPREVDSFEELVSPRNSFSSKVPASESLKSSSLELKTKVVSDMQTDNVSRSVGAPICVPIQRPAPIELPISKLLPSDIVDEVHASGDQLPPITEPWGLPSLSLGPSNDELKQFKWKMWDTPQLGQISLPKQVEPSQSPVRNGMFEQENDFLPPCSEGSLLSPFEPEARLPSCLFSPQKKPNTFNQSSGECIGGASVSSSNSLWLNQQAFESAEGSWDITDHGQLPPGFCNGDTQGEVQDSVISTDCLPTEQIPTGFWLKSGIDGVNKSKWSGEAAVDNSCWSTTIKSSTRPHVGGIYATPHVQSLWSYK